jgi:putative DNA primase/helicase
MSQQLSPQERLAYLQPVPQSPPPTGGSEAPDDGPVADEPEPIPASVFFGDRNNLIVARLGEAIRQAGHVRTGTDGRLYRYQSGVYRPDGETWVRARVREALGDRVRRDHFAEVLTWLRSFEPTVGSRPPEHLLNVANGLLEWQSGVLRPHDPSVVTTIQLPVPWRPDAHCPRIQKFLSEVVPADTVQIVEEIMGYALYAANPLRKAVLLLGSGGNGKSKLLAVVAGLAGQRNVASVPVQVFGENRFASAELFGKLANIAGDLDARAIKRTDVFKMITGGDPIMAERKNCHPFNFVSFALPLFSANEPPISSDQTQAWFDRWIIVPMERRFEGTEGCDPNLEAKLTTEDELAGGLVMAVEGLRRLMRRGRFAEPDSVRGAGEQYRDRLDTVRGFVAEETVLRFDAWCPRPALYKAYRRWCQDSGKYPVSAENFNAHLRQNYPTQLEERTRRGTRGWGGIGLSTDEGEE